MAVVALLFFLGVGVLWILWARKVAKPPPGEQVTSLAEDVCQQGYGREYRLPNDPHHILRFAQPPPPGLTHKLFEDIPIDGFVLGAVPANAEAFIDGNARHLELERDSLNREAPYAIKVIGVWQDPEGNERHGQIGWLPLEVAQDIVLSHSATPLGATLRMLSKPRLGKEPELRIDIWYASGQSSA